ncbi:unnamed protein product, partial [Iphiclides podalirius]
MMACSYLSAAGPKPQPSTAGCWTPPNYTCLPQPDSLSGPTGPLFAKPQAGTSLSATCQEPALDLSTNSASLVPRHPPQKTSGGAE